MECYGFELTQGNEEIKSLFQLTRNTPRKRENVPAGEFRRVKRYLRRTELVYLPKHYLINLLEALGIKNHVKDVVNKLMNKRTNTNPN